MCLAQGHNPVMPVRLEPTTPQSRVKHSTTELPYGSKLLTVKVQSHCRMMPQTNQHVCIIWGLNPNPPYLEMVTLAGHIML